MTESQIRQSIDGGVPIQKLVRQFPSKREAIDFYIKHIQSRFPIEQANTQIQWKIVYYTRKDVFFSFMGLLGHIVHLGKLVEIGTKTHSEAIFSTFHVFVPQDQKRLQQRYAHAQSLRTLSQIVTIMVAGAAGSYAFMMIYEQLHDGLDDTLIAPFIAAFLLTLICFFAGKLLFKYPIPQSVRFLTLSKCELIEIKTASE